jgi:hypothetical protein
VRDVSDGCSRIGVELMSILLALGLILCPEGRIIKSLGKEKYWGILKSIYYMTFDNCKNLI